MQVHVSVILENGSLHQQRQDVFQLLRSENIQTNGIVRLIAVEIPVT